jgi:hypothetical protein
MARWHRDHDRAVIEQVRVKEFHPGDFRRALRDLNLTPAERVVAVELCEFAGIERPIVWPFSRDIGRTLRHDPAGCLSDSEPVGGQVGDLVRGAQQRRKEPNNAVASHRASTAKLSTAGYSFWRRNCNRER